MAIGKMTRFSKGKRVARKRKRKRGAPKITRNVLSKKSIVKMNYVDTVSIDPGVAAITSHVFRANSIFDPDFTGIGHQPFTHDTFQTLYRDYRVTHCRMKVTPLSNDGANVVPGLWGVYSDADTTLTYPSGTSVIEDPRNNNKWGLTSMSANRAGDQYTGPLTLTFNASELGPEGQFNVVPFGANPGSTSAYSKYFQLWTSSISGNDPLSSDFLIELDYTVELTNPIHLAQS